MIDNHNNNCHTIITTSNIRWVQSSTAVLHKIRRGLALWARTASRCMPWDVLVPCWQSLVSVGMARIHIDHSWIIIIYEYLVGGLEHEFYDFPYIGNVISPTDFHILNIADFGKVDQCRWLQWKRLVPRMTSVGGVNFFRRRHPKLELIYNPFIEPIHRTHS